MIWPTERPSLGVDQFSVHTIITSRTRPLILLRRHQYDTSFLPNTFPQQLFPGSSPLYAQTSNNECLHSQVSHAIDCMPSCLNIDLQ